MFALVAAICHRHIAILSFESRIQKIKAERANALSAFMVRVARLELAASWSQTAREDFFTSKTAVFLRFDTKTELFNNNNSVDSDRYFSGSGQICGQNMERWRSFAPPFVNGIPVESIP